MNDYIGNFCCGIQSHSKRSEAIRFEMNELIFRIADVDDYAAGGEGWAELLNDCLNEGILTSGR